MSGQQPFVVGPDRRALGFSVCVFTALTMLDLSIVVFDEPEFMTWVGLLLFPLFLVAAIWMIVRNKPLVTLDDSGVRAGKRVSAPWSSFERAEVTNLRLGRLPSVILGRCVLLFPVGDADAVAQLFPKWRQRTVRALTRRYGTPFVIPERNTNRTAEEVTTAVARLGELPWTHDPNTPHEKGRLPFAPFAPIVALSLGLGLVLGAGIGSVQDPDEVLGWAVVAVGLLIVGLASRRLR